MGAKETFVQNVNKGNWGPVADQLNGSPMYDILPFLAALGTNAGIAANNISGLLRKRGWIGAAQRIAWAGDVVRTRTIPNPPPGLPNDQVENARSFLARQKASSPGGSPAAGGSAFTIDMSSPFQSGWKGGLGGPGTGGHSSSDWYIQYGMDLGVEEGTEVRAAFSGYVTKFEPHNPRADSAKEYGAKLFMRSDNHSMGAFYTHFTGGRTFAVGDRIERGDLLGRTIRDHLHLALVEIIGGTKPGQQADTSRYVGVNLYGNFLGMRDTSKTISVTFKQNRTPPAVSEPGLPMPQ